MTKNKRITIEIPANDEEATAWCSNQGRMLSLAIRMLIQKEVHRPNGNGIGNYFASSLTQDKQQNIENKKFQVNIKNKTTQKQKASVKTKENANKFDNSQNNATPDYEAAKTEKPVNSQEAKQIEKELNDMMMN